MGKASPWREVEHDLEVEGSIFQERHHNEFVTFLPYVQQFLYGEGRAHLGTDALYAEVKERTADMNGYLEADSLRRQANTVVRLTVVKIFGLIGTITTGFLGMNLLAEAESPLAAVWRRGAD